MKRSNFIAAVGAGLSTLITVVAYAKKLQDTIPHINISTGTITREALKQTMEYYRNGLEASKTAYKYSSFDNPPSYLLDYVSTKKIGYMTRYNEGNVSFPLITSDGKSVKDIMLGIYDCIKSKLEQLPDSVTIGVSQVYRPIWEQIQAYLNGASELLPDSLTRNPSHIYGLAADFTVYQSGWKPELNYTYRGSFNPCYQKYEKYVIWGARWHTLKDYPHFQMRWNMLSKSTQDNIIKERKRIVAQFKTIYNGYLEKLKNDYATSQ